MNAVHERLVQALNFGPGCGNVVAEQGIGVFHYTRLHECAGAAIEVHGRGAALRQGGDVLAGQVERGKELGLAFFGRVLGRLQQVLQDFGGD
jgi:hypothetical protein